MVTQLQKYDLDKKIRWLRMFITFKFFKSTIYIKAILERIKTHKLIFIQQVERGKEVLIEGDMSMDHLPRSFHYYDFILNYIMENLN